VEISLRLDSSVWPVTTKGKGRRFESLQVRVLAVVAVTIFAVITVIAIITDPLDAIITVTVEGAEIGSVSTFTLHHFVGVDGFKTLVLTAYVLG